jgi:valyl-tRNA synthetase
MSKSVGNVIDPIDIIPKFGTDALRLSMIIGSTPGSNLRLYEEKIESYRNFVNKLYNISRYVLLTVKKVKRVGKKPKAKTLADEWILNELDKTILSVTEKIEAFQFSAAGETLREFTWDTLADWYLEIAKIEEGKDDILLYLLEKVLILWHPFTPFVTEHIWENFKEDEFLMVQSWPQVIKEDIKTVDFDLIQQVISTIRNLRAENKIEPVLKLKALVISQYDKQIKKQSEIIKRLARLEAFEVVEHADERPKQSAAGVFGEGNTVYLLLEGIIDLDKEKARLEKEIDSTLKVLTVTSAKLDNKNFVQGAPVDIVEKEKATFTQAEDKLKKLRDQLESLK